MPSKATRLDFLRGGGQVWLGRNEIIDGRGSSANRVRSEKFRLYWNFHQESHDGKRDKRRKRGSPAVRRIFSFQLGKAILNFNWRVGSSTFLGELMKRGGGVDGGEWE